MGLLKKLNDAFYTTMSAEEFDEKLNKAREASRIKYACLKDGLLTLITASGREVKYKNRNNNWYKYPMMEFISLDANGLQIITYIEEHGNPYPTAHLNKPQP